jgi:hypothetical protein
VIVSSNYDVSNLTIKFFNDQIHDTVFNFTVEVFHDILKFKLDYKIMMQKNEKDKNYEREFFKGNFDIEKAMRGIQENYFLRAFFENFAKSAEYEPKKNMKFKKVNRRI